MKISDRTWVLGWLERSYTESYVLEKILGTVKGISTVPENS